MLLILFTVLLASCASPYKTSWDKRKFYESFHFNHSSETYDQDFSPIWPVDRARMTQTFAPPKNPAHDGVDLAAQKKTPILSVQKGKVIYSGSGFKGYGKMVLIQHNKSWSTLYAHLNRTFVRQGDVVGQGKVIGLMGKTGRASGVHLHFEVLKNKLPIDPLLVLPTTQQMVTSK